jgi:hypothetical protein
MSIVRTAVVQGAVTAMSLQARITKTIHLPNLSKSLIAIRGFERRRLRLNHTERQKAREAQQNNYDKPITSILLQPQRGI